MLVTSLTLVQVSYSDPSLGCSMKSSVSYMSIEKSSEEGVYSGSVLCFFSVKPFLFPY